MDLFKSKINKNSKNVNCEDLFEMYMNHKTKYKLTATDIRQYVEAPFYLYCNNFVDRSEMDKIPDAYLVELAKMGREHEEKINQEEFPNSEPMIFDTPEDGFRKVLDSMTSKTTAILNAPLYYLPEGLYGTADQIVKEDGRSIFGKHHYVIKEIKIAKNIKQGHILQAALYNHILGKIQGYTPDTFYLINMEKHEIPYKFAEYEGELFDNIEGVFRIKGGERPSPTFGSCMYPWNDYCNKIALAERDVSLLHGVGLKMKNKLVEAGCSKLDDVVNTSKQNLMNIDGIGSITANKMTHHANAILKNQAIRIKQPKPLSEKTTEIFFDLEGIDFATQTAHELDMTDYLIGAIIRKNNKEEYISFVAKNIDSEKKMVKEFIEFLGKQKDYVLYHWASYEKTHMTKMMEKYDIPSDDQQLVLSKNVLCDLHPIVTSSYVFPIPGTGLKPIAKWMGYQWKHADVGAMSSIDLYLKYTNDPETHLELLDKVIDYNKDDCVATRIIKDWYVSSICE